MKFKRYNFKKIFFKTVAFVLIQAFIALDMSWAAGGKITSISKTQEANLAPNISISQQAFKENINLLYDLSLNSVDKSSNKLFSLQGNMPVKIKSAQKPSEVQSKKIPPKPQSRTSRIVKLVAIIGGFFAIGAVLHLMGPLFVLYLTKVKLLSIISLPLIKVFAIVFEVILPLTIVVSAGQIIWYKLILKQEPRSSEQDINYLERFGIRTVVGDEHSKKMQSIWAIIFLWLIGKKIEAQNMMFERIAGQYGYTKVELETKIKDSGGCDVNTLGFNTLAGLFFELKRHNFNARIRQNRLLNQNSAWNSKALLLWRLLYEFAIYAIAQPFGYTVYAKRDFLNKQLSGEVIELFLKREKERIEDTGYEDNRLKEKFIRGMIKGRWSFSQILLRALIGSTLMLPLTSGLRLIKERIGLVIYSSISRGVLTAFLTYLVSMFTSGSAALGAGKLLGFSFISAGVPLISALTVTVIVLRLLFKMSWFRNSSLFVRASIIAVSILAIAACAIYLMPVLLTFSLSTSFGVLKIGSAITHFFSLQNLLGAYSLGLLRFVPRYYKEHKQENIANSKLFTKGLDVHRLEAQQIFSYISSIKLEQLPPEQIRSILITLKANLATNSIVFSKNSPLSPDLGRIKIQELIANLENMVDDVNLEQEIKDLIDKQKKAKLWLKTNALVSTPFRGIETVNQKRRVNIFKQAISSGIHIAMVDPEISLLLNGSLAIDDAFSSLLGAKVTLIHDFVSLIESQHGVIGAGSAVMNEIFAPIGIQPDNLIFQTLTQPLLKEENMSIQDVWNTAVVEERNNQENDSRNSFPGLLTAAAKLIGVSEAEAKMLTKDLNKHRKTNFGQQEKSKKESTEKTNLIYTVKKGDTLAKIAKRLLGDAFLWPEIYDAYNAQYSDPEKHIQEKTKEDGRKIYLIYPGQKLPIPQKEDKKTPEKEKSVGKDSKVAKTEEKGAEKYKDFIPVPKRNYEKNIANMIVQLRVNAQGGKAAIAVDSITKQELQENKNLNLHFYYHNTDNNTYEEVDPRDEKGTLYNLIKQDIEDKTSKNAQKIEIWVGKKGEPGSREYIVFAYDSLNNIPQDKLHFYEYAKPGDEVDELGRGKELTDLEEVAEVKEKGINVDIWLEDVNGKNAHRLNFGKVASDESINKMESYILKRDFQNILINEILGTLDITKQDRLIKDYKKQGIYGDIPADLMQQNSPFIGAIVENDEGMPAEVKAYIQSENLDQAYADILKLSKLDKETGFDKVYYFYKDKNGDLKSRRMYFLRYNRKGKLVEVNARSAHDKIVLENKTKKGATCNWSESDEVIFGKNALSKRILDTKIGELAHYITVENAKKYQKQLKQRMIFETILMPINIAGGYATGGALNMLAQPASQAGLRLAFDMIFTSANLPDSVKVKGPPSKENLETFIYSYLYYEKGPGKGKKVKPFEQLLQDNEFLDYLKMEKIKEESDLKLWLNMAMDDETSKDLIEYIQGQKDYSVAMFCLNILDNLARLNYKGFQKSNMFKDVLASSYFSLNGDINIMAVIGALTGDKVLGAGLNMQAVREGWGSFWENYANMFGVAVKAQSIINILANISRDKTVFPYEPDIKKGRLFNVSFLGFPIFSYFDLKSSQGFTSYADKFAFEVVAKPYGIDKVTPFTEEQFLKLNLVPLGKVKITEGKKKPVYKVYYYNPATKGIVFLGKEGYERRLAKLEKDVEKFDKFMNLMGFSGGRIEHRFYDAAASLKSSMQSTEYAKNFSSESMLSFIKKFSHPRYKGLLTPSHIYPLKVDTNKSNWLFSYDMALESIAQRSVGFGSQADKILDFFIDNRWIYKHDTNSKAEKEYKSKINGGVYNAIDLSIELQSDKKPVAEYLTHAGPNAWLGAVMLQGLMRHTDTDKWKEVLEEWKSEKDKLEEFYKSGDIEDYFDSRGETQWRFLGMRNTKLDDFRDSMDKQGEKYLKQAESTAEFLLKLQDDDGGIRHGPGQLELKSTEENIVSFGFFSMLYDLSGDDRYKETAKGILKWLSTSGVYDKKGFFYRGMQNKSMDKEHPDWQPEGIYATDANALAIIVIKPEILNNIREKDKYLFGNNTAKKIIANLEKHNITTDHYIKGKKVAQDVAGFDYTDKLGRGERQEVISPEMTAHVIKAYKTMAAYYEKTGQQELAEKAQSKAEFFEENIKKLSLRTKFGTALPDTSMPGDLPASGFKRFKDSKPAGVSLASINALWIVLAKEDINPFQLNIFNSNGKKFTGFNQEIHKPGDKLITPDDKTNIDRIIELIETKKTSKLSEKENDELNKLKKKHPYYSGWIKMQELIKKKEQGINNGDFLISCDRAKGIFSYYDASLDLVINTTLIPSAKAIAYEYEQKQIESKNAEKMLELYDKGGVIISDESGRVIELKASNTDKSMPNPIEFFIKQQRKEVIAGHMSMEDLESSMKTGTFRAKYKGKEVQAALVFPIRKQAVLDTKNLITGEKELHIYEFGELSKIISKNKIIMVDKENPAESRVYVNQTRKLEADSKPGKIIKETRKIIYPEAENIEELRNTVAVERTDYGYNLLYERFIKGRYIEFYKGEKLIGRIDLGKHTISFVRERGKKDKKYPGRENKGMDTYSYQNDKKGELISYSVDKNLAEILKKVPDRLKTAKKAMVIYKRKKGLKGEFIWKETQILENRDEYIATITPDPLYFSQGKQVINIIDYKNKLLGIASGRRTFAYDGNKIWEGLGIAERIKKPTYTSAKYNSLVEELNNPGVECYRITDKRRGITWKAFYDYEYGQEPVARIEEGALYVPNYDENKVVKTEDVYELDDNGIGRKISRTKKNEVLSKQSNRNGLAKDLEEKGYKKTANLIRAPETLIYDIEILGPDEETPVKSFTAIFNKYQEVAKIDNTLDRISIKFFDGKEPWKEKAGIDYDYENKEIGEEFGISVVLRDKKGEKTKKVFTFDKKNKLGKIELRDKVDGAVEAEQSGEYTKPEQIDEMFSKVKSKQWGKIKGLIKENWDARVDTKNSYKEFVNKDKQKTRFSPAYLRRLGVPSSARSFLVSGPKQETGESALGELNFSKNKDDFAKLKVKLIKREVLGNYSEEKNEKKNNEKNEKDKTLDTSKIPDKYTIEIKDEQGRRLETWSGATTGKNMQERFKNFKRTKRYLEFYFSGRKDGRKKYHGRFKIADKSAVIEDNDKEQRLIALSNSVSIFENGDIGYVTQKGVSKKSLAETDYEKLWFAAKKETLALDGITKSYKEIKNNRGHLKIILDGFGIENIGFNGFIMPGAEPRYITFLELNGDKKELLFLSGISAKGTTYDYIPESSKEDGIKQDLYKDKKIVALADNLKVKKGIDPRTGEEIPIAEYDVKNSLHSRKSIAKQAIRLYDGTKFYEQFEGKILSGKLLKGQFRNIKRLYYDQKGMPIKTTLVINSKKEQQDKDHYVVFVTDANNKAIRWVFDKKIIESKIDKIINWIEEFIDGKQIKNSLDFLPGDFNESNISVFNLIKIISDELKIAVPSNESLHKNIEWLNKSIAPYKIFNNYMSEKELGDSGKNLVEKIAIEYGKKLQNFSDMELKKLADTNNGKQLKRIILIKRYRKDTPNVKRDQILFLSKHEIATIAESDGAMFFNGEKVLEKPDMYTVERTSQPLPVFFGESIDFLKKLFKYHIPDNSAFTNLFFRTTKIFVPTVCVLGIAIGLVVPSIAVLLMLAIKITGAGIRKKFKKRIFQKEEKNNNTVFNHERERNINNNELTDEEMEHILDKNLGALSYRTPVRGYLKKIIKTKTKKEAEEITGKLSRFLSVFIYYQTDKKLKNQRSGETVIKDGRYILDDEEMDNLFFYSEEKDNPINSEQFQILINSDVLWGEFVKSKDSIVIEQALDGLVRKIKKYLDKKRQAGKLVPLPRYPLKFGLFNLHFYQIPKAIYTIWRNRDNFDDSSYAPAEKEAVRFKRYFWKRILKQWIAFNSVLSIATVYYALGVMPGLVFVPSILLLLVCMRLSYRSIAYINMAALQRIISSEEKLYTVRSFEDVKQKAALLFKQNHEKQKEFVEFVNRELFGEKETWTGNFINSSEQKMYTENNPSKWIKPKDKQALQMIINWFNLEYMPKPDVVVAEAVQSLNQSIKQGDKVKIEQYLNDIKDKCKTKEIKDKIKEILSNLKNDKDIKWDELRLKVWEREIPGYTVRHSAVNEQYEVMFGYYKDAPRNPYNELDSLDTRSGIGMLVKTRFSLVKEKFPIQWGNFVGKIHNKYKLTDADRGKLLNNKTTAEESYKIMVYYRNKEELNREGINSLEDFLKVDFFEVLTKYDSDGEIAGLLRRFCNWRLENVWKTVEGSWKGFRDERRSLGKKIFDQKKNDKLFIEKRINEKINHIIIYTTFDPSEIKADERNSISIIQHMREHENDNWSHNETGQLVFVSLHGNKGISSSKYGSWAHSREFVKQPFLFALDSGHRIESFDVRFTANALQSFTDNPRLANINPALYIYNEHISSTSYANAVGEKTFNIRSQRQKNYSDTEGFYGKGIWRVLALDESKAVLSQFITEDTMSSIQALLAGWQINHIEYIRVAQSAEKVRFEAAGFILRFGGPVVEMFLSQSFQNFLKNDKVHWTEKLGMLFNFDFYFNKNWVAAANILIYLLAFFTSYNIFVYLAGAWIAALVGLIASQAINAQTLITMEEENKHPILAFWKDFIKLFFYYTSFVPEHYLKVKQGTKGLGVFTFSPRTSDITRKGFKEIFREFKFGIGMGIFATIMILLGPFYPIAWAVNIFFIVMAVGWWLTPFMMNPSLSLEEVFKRTSGSRIKGVLWQTTMGNIFMALSSWIVFPLYCVTWISYGVMIRKRRNFINNLFEMDKKIILDLSKHENNNNLRNFYERLYKLKAEFPKEVIQNVRNILLENEPSDRKELEKEILPWKVFSKEDSLKEKIAQAGIYIIADYFKKKEELNRKNKPIEPKAISAGREEPSIKAIGSDYDKTLSEGSLENNPGILERIIGLLGHKVNFAIMSGSNVNTQMTRVIEPLMKEMEKEKLDLDAKRQLIDYLTIYGNGVGSKYTFDINDDDKVEVYLDEKYTKNNGVDEADIKRIQQKAEEIVLDYIGSDSEGITRKEIRDEMGRTSLPGGKGTYGPRKAPEFEQRGSWVKRQEDGRSKVCDENEPGAEFIPTLLAINNIFFKCIDNKDYPGIPDKFKYKKQLDEWLKKEGLTDKYDTRHGGGATGFTIEIFRKGLEKDVAMRDFIAANNLEAESTGYFGDEFYEGGNDHIFITTEEEKVKEIKIFAVNTEDIPAPDYIQEHPRVIYREGGPESTKEIFKEIIEEHDATKTKGEESESPEKNKDLEIKRKGEEIFWRMVEEILTGKTLPDLEPFESQEDIDESGFLPISKEHEYITGLKDNEKAEITVLFDKDGEPSYKFKIAYSKKDRDISDKEINRIASYLSTCIYNHLLIIGAVRVLVYAPNKLYQAIDTDFRKRFDSEEQRKNNKSISGYLHHVINNKPFEFRQATDEEIEKILSKGTLNLTSKKTSFDTTRGNLVGIDLGGTAIKAVAIVNGKKVKEHSVKWFPQEISDPKTHLRLIIEVIKDVSKDMNSIDAIGISWAGATTKGRIIGSGPITQGLNSESNDFQWLKDNLNEYISTEFGNAVVYVSNDGDAGVFGTTISMSLDDAVGFGMGTGLAFAYVDKNSNLNTKILGEGGNVIIDMNPLAPKHTWTGVPGVLQRYLSQWGVVWEAEKAGIEEIKEANFQDKAKIVGELLEKGDPRAQKVFENIGRYLAVAIAEYHQYFNMKNIVIFGGVTTGKSGKVIKGSAEKVLNDKFPDLEVVIRINPKPQYAAAIGAAQMANKEQQTKGSEIKIDFNENNVLKIRKQMNILVKENNIILLEKIILNEDRKSNDDRNWKLLTEAVAARNKLGKSKNERIRTIYQENLLWCPKEEGRRDLHFHSMFSDGQKDIEGIIKESVDKVIKVIALTDHNNVTGVKQVSKVAESYGIEIIPAVEIAAFNNFKGIKGEAGTEIHILGYGLDIENSQLKNLIERINALFLLKWMNDVYNLLMIDKKTENKNELLGKLKESYVDYMNERAEFYRQSNLEKEAEKIRTKLLSINEEDWQKLFVLIKSINSGIEEKAILKNWDLLKKFVQYDVQYQNAFEEFRKQMEEKLKDKGIEVKESRYGLWNRENRSLPILPTAEEVIDIIHNAGGVAVFAHPRWYTEIVMPGENISEKESIVLIKDYVEYLSNSGLDGLEVYTHWVDDRDSFWQKVAEKNNLLVTGGTDSHFIGKEAFGLGKGEEFYLEGRFLKALNNKIFKANSIKEEAARKFIFDKKLTAINDLKMAEKLIGEAI